MPRNTSVRRLMVESPESRAMLAGNVTVSVIANFLRIVGDNLDNDIEIREVQQTYEIGQWPGVKLEVIGHGDTTVNGQASAQLAEGIKKGAFIGLQGGDNELQIGNTSKTPPPGTKPVYLPGRVQIGSWNGDDGVQLTINNGWQVTINQGPGADGIYMTRSNVNVLTVNSDPIPTLGQAPVGEDDLLVFRTVRAKGDVSLSAGEGFNQVKVLDDSVFDAAFSLDAGYDANFLLIGDTTWNGTASIQGGSDEGGDGFFVAGIVTGNLAVSLAGGRDRLNVGIIGGGSLTVFAGSGDDSITIRDSVLSSFSLDGEEGVDKLTRTGTNDLGETDITNIEQDTTA